jgi:hypothetical protein
VLAIAPAFGLLGSFTQVISRVTAPCLAWSVFQRR